MQKFWMVWNPGNWLPTKRHETHADAITEAERLCVKHPNQDFIVLESVCWRRGETAVKKPAGDAPYGDGEKSREGAGFESRGQEAVKKEDGGWITHNQSSTCPVSAETLVYILSIDGFQYGQPCTARQFSWAGVSKYKIAKPQPDKDGWIPHVPGDPMPCGTHDAVYIKLASGEVPDVPGPDVPAPAFFRHWGKACDPALFIVGWRRDRPKRGWCW